MFVFSQDPTFTIHSGLLELFKHTSFQSSLFGLINLINKMRVGVSLTIIVLTALAFSETLGQEISFDGGFEYNETCGLSPTAYWSSEGTVTLTSADFIGFEPKVVVRAYHDLCTVDLTTCPPDHLVTSSQPCFCRSRVDDTYHIHVGSQISRSQVGGTLEAVVPGHGPLKNIFAAANIGTLPSATDNQQLVKASYILDNSEPRDLMYSQNVTLCSGKRVFLEICVNNNGHPAAVLTITVGNKTGTVKGDRCIPHLITPGQTKELTFVYKEQEGCTQIHQMYFEENSQACVVPTADTVTSSAPTTTKEVTTMTVATTTAETPTSFQINGICPDTPRTVTTLPSGEQVLTDDVTYIGSWTVFQRRVSGDVDFYRPWAAYVAGFGNINDSFWVGLEEIHGLCNEKRHCELLIHLKYDETPHTVPMRADGCYYALYYDFWLGGSNDNYTLHLSNYTGTAGDSLLHPPGLNDRYIHNGQPFSTMDHDMDSSSKNCAAIHYGAWWYKNCEAANLNAGWGRRGQDWTGLEWWSLTEDSSVTLSEMKVRPRS